MAGPIHAQVISTAIAPYVTGSSVIGRVQSGFSAALNVEFGDELVTFAAPSTGALPNGVVLDRAADLHMPRGAVVWSDGHAVRCMHLTIELDGAQLWSPVLGRSGPFRPLAEVRGPLVVALRRRAVMGGFSPLLWRIARSELPIVEPRGYSAIQEIMRAVSELDVDGMVAAARRLVGLGEGLTPSGDDFLIGFAAALRSADHPLQAKFATACHELARDRTTSVAEMFYRFAARGAFSARLHRLVSSLSDPAVDLTTELELALAWGASSGADCLLGVLLGGEGARSPSLARAEVA
jgi:hypothetical protein